MELRPPMILTADRFETQDDGSLSLFGIRHIFESDTFPYSRSIALYCFLGTMREQQIDMSLYLENHQVKEETLLMSSVVQGETIAVPALIPNITFPVPGFYSFQLRVQHKLYAWCRVQAIEKQKK